MWQRRFDRRSVKVDQMTVASDPPADEELAAIADAPEPAANVLAREPDVPLPDPAEQSWSCRPYDSHIVKRHEVIGVFCVQRHGPPSGVRAEHTW
jgi:hypothetical protein